MTDTEDNQEESSQHSSASLSSVPSILSEPDSSQQSSSDNPPPVTTVSPVTIAALQLTTIMSTDPIEEKWKKYFTDTTAVTEEDLKQN